MYIQNPSFGTVVTTILASCRSTRHILLFWIYIHLKQIKCLYKIFQEVFEDNWICYNFMKGNEVKFQKRPIRNYSRNQKPQHRNQSLHRFVWSVGWRSIALNKSQPNMINLRTYMFLSWYSVTMYNFWTHFHIKFTFETKVSNR